MKSPVDIFVPKTNLRCSQKDTKAHYIKLPNYINVAYVISDNLSIVSPEFLFLQLVQSGDLIYAAEMALEMCGTYCIDKVNSSTVYNVKPLTTTNSICNYLNRLGNGNKRIQHINIAKRLASFLTDGSKSPQESKLYLKLALPKSMGGQNMSNLLFNYPADQYNASRSFSSTHMLSCDLANPDKKIAIECENQEVPNANDEAPEDKSKTEILQNMGWKVFTFLPSEVEDIEAFNKKASMIARALGKRAGSTREDFPLKQEILFDKLK